MAAARRPPAAARRRQMSIGSAAAAAIISAKIIFDLMHFIVDNGLCIMVTSRSYPETESEKEKTMRKFTNTEASNVADLVDVTLKIRELQSQLRELVKHQTNCRADVQVVIDAHGEAHNADHVITTTSTNVAGYTVAAKLRTKWNIGDR